VWLSMSRMETGRPGASVRLASPSPSIHTRCSRQEGKKRLTGSFSWK
jgi:hypothetical protein